MLVAQSQEDALTIKFIEIDMDGTLLNYKHGITSSMKNVIVQREEKGCTSYWRPVDPISSCDSIFIDSLYSKF